MKFAYYKYADIQISRDYCDVPDRNPEKQYFLVGANSQAGHDFFKKHFASAACGAVITDPELDRFIAAAVEQGCTFGAK